MKKILVCILVMIVCLPVMAGVRDLTDEEIARMDAGFMADVRKVLDTKNDMNDLIVMDEKSSEFQQLKSDVIKEYPELESILSQYPSKKHPVIIRGFLARKTFDEFKNKYIADLLVTGFETGRETKKTVEHLKIGETLDMHLDEGILDTQKCQWDFETRNACDYPDGFTEYRVVYHTANDMQELTVFKDIPEKNTRITFSALLNAAATDNNADIAFDTGLLHVSMMETDYDKWYAYRNQYSKDIRNGMFVRCTKNCGGDDPRSPFRRIEWKVDESRKWQSQNIPGWKVVAINESWFSTIRQ